MIDSDLQLRLKKKTTREVASQVECWEECPGPWEQLAERPQGRQRAVLKCSQCDRLIKSNKERGMGWTWREMKELDYTRSQ